MALKSGVNDRYSVETDPGIVAEINITPLTDIFLVLLIIFMVTSSAMSQLGVNVELPRSSQSSSQAQPEGVIVTLLSEGSFKINNESVREGDFKNFDLILKKMLAKTSSKLVILEGDRRAFLGSAIEVMDRARRAGAEKFAIATSLESSGDSAKPVSK